MGFAAQKMPELKGEGHSSAEGWEEANWGKKICETTRGLDIKVVYSRASLVAQWLRIRLPMQGTWVQALVWEDPTCRRATKPVCLNYWACTLDPKRHNKPAHPRATTEPTCLEPGLRNKGNHSNEKPAHHNEEYPCSLQLEKACVQQQRPNAAKNKLIKRKKLKREKVYK